MRSIISFAFFIMPIVIGGVATYELARVIAPSVGMMIGHNGQLAAACAGCGLGLVKSLLL